MKYVIKDKELKDVMQKAIDLLCDTAASTLGPSGNNVIINHELSPYITNDGVTIAKAIESDDIRINTILEIAKEASLKTNEIAGDGTTTTLVLLQSLLREGIKETNENINPINLKKELNDSLKILIKEINKIKRKPTDKDLEAIAFISSEDNNIGNLAIEVYSKMKSKYSIRLEENNNEKTYYEVKKGYNIEIDNISNLYFKNKDEIKVSNVYVLIIRGYLNSLEDISSIINECIERNKNIVIIASDYDDNIKNEALLYYAKYNKNIFIFKTPDYGSRKELIEEDLAVLSGASIKNINHDSIYFNDLGVIKDIIINKNEIILLNDNINVDKRILNLEKEFLKQKDDYEKEFLTNRISKFKNGVATIYVGGNTKTEIKEKIMKFEDALCALEVASNGVVIGEGVTFLYLINKLDDNTIGKKIIKTALETPFKKIMINAGEDYKKIKEKIIKSNYKKIYNLETNYYDNIEKTKIIDPAIVIIEALKNAISIALILLTTNYLVINEEKTNKDTLI